MQQCGLADALGVGVDALVEEAAGHARPLRRPQHRVHRDLLGRCREQGMYYLKLGGLL